MDAVTASRARVLLLALPVVVALGGTAQAADGSSGPPPIVSIPAPSTSAAPSAPNFAAPRGSASSARATHRATTSTPHHYRSTTRYRAPSTRSSAAPSSVSDSASNAPTQTFVLGSASLGSLSSSPVVTASPSSRPASAGDGTDRYVHVFFAVVVAAALLLAAGVTGLILTRDGRHSGGTHR